VPTLNPKPLTDQLAGDLGFEGFGLGLVAGAREVSVEVGAERAAGAAFEGAGSVKGSEAGVVLGEALVRFVPGLADVEVVVVAVELDDVNTVAARFGDVLGARDEVEAEFEIVAVAGEVVIVDVIAVEALGYELTGFGVEQVIEQERAQVAGSLTDELAELGAPGVVGVALGARN